MGNVKACWQNTRRLSKSLVGEAPKFCLFPFLDDRIFIHLEDVKRSQNLCIVFLRARPSLFIIFLLLCRSLSSCTARLILPENILLQQNICHGKMKILIDLYSRRKWRLCDLSEITWTPTKGGAAALAKSPTAAKSFSDSPPVSLFVSEWASTFSFSRCYVENTQVVLDARTFHLLSNENQCANAIFAPVWANSLSLYKIGWKNSLTLHKRSKQIHYFLVKAFFWWYYYCLKEGFGGIG